MNNGFAAVVLSTLAATLRMAVPLGFASIGGAISEKSGIIALGLEGYMTIGAFFAVLGAYLFQNPWGGVLFAAGAGGLFALIYGVMCIRFKADQTVGGLGMNTIAPGLVAMLMVSIFGNKGKSEIVPNLPPIRVPILNRVPVIGQLLEGHTALFYLLFVVAALAWVVMYRTPAGIRLRATGTHPEVIDSLGLRSHRIQYVSVAVSGILAGIGGAYLSIGQLNFYSLDMVAGRGFISTAVFVFAKWNPIACLWVAMLFGFTEAIQMRLQVFELPSQIIQMIPYFSTLLVLASLHHTRKSGRAQQ